MTYIEEQVFTKMTYEVLDTDKIHKWVVDPMGDYTRLRFYEKMGGHWVLLSDENWANEFVAELFDLED